MLKFKLGCYMVQDQSSQTTYHPKNGEKACPCCQFYGVPCHQVRATEDEATTTRNQRLFSSTKRKRSHQEQLADDSLFLDGPSVDELQTIQKRKDSECSRDTQVKNQALYDYVWWVDYHYECDSATWPQGVQKASNRNDARCDVKFTGRSTK